MYYQFKNTKLVPYQELLDKHLGLSIAKGGPMYEDWDELIYPRQLRSNFKRIDNYPDDRISEKKIQSDTVWGGAFCNHFGHQIADFSMRLLDSKLHYPDTPIIFMSREYSQFSSYQKCPKWFMNILEYFEINDVIVSNQPLIVDRLHVVPQGELLDGPPPNEEYLLKITNHAEKKIRTDKTLAKQVYVSRSQIPGKLAGELYLDEFFRTNNFQVIYPEKMTLIDQLSVYKNASMLIFAEGSALHGLQLLGTGLKDIKVIERRGGKNLGKNFLLPRAQSVSYINAVTTNINRLKADGEIARAKSLPIVNISLLISHLEREGVHFTTDVNKEKYFASVEYDVRQWIKQLAKSVLTPGSDAAIISSLEKSGFSHLIDYAKAQLKSAKFMTLESRKQQRKKNQTMQNLSNN